MKLSIIYCANSTASVPTAKRKEFNHSIKVASKTQLCLCVWLALPSLAAKERQETVRKSFRTGSGC